MEDGPPEKNPICPKCGIRTRRIYTPVPIKFVGDGFSTSGKFDRPDERLDKEIKASMSRDPTTGEEWEAQDKRLEKKKKRFGETMRKDFSLPQSENK